MALDLGTLVGKLSLDPTQWTTGFGSAEESAKRFGTNVPTWMAVTAGALLAVGTAALVGLYKVGETFDEVRDTIRIGTGAVGDDLDGLVANAENVATRVPASFDKVGQTVADLNTRLGLSGDMLETVAAQFLEAGRMLGEDIDIQSATGALNVFGTASEDVSGRLDFLFQTSQATGIGMNDLIQRLQTAGPITQQLGFSFEQTAAMIGVMDKAGLDSQGMIAAMQRGLVNLATDGEAPADAFRRVTSEIQGFVDKGDQAAALDLAGQVFGTRGAAQFVGALQTGQITMEDFIASANLSGDTILGVAEDTQDFAEKWQIVQNKATAALEPLGSAVFEALGAALEWMMPGLDAVTQWMEENPELVQGIAIFLGVLAGAFIVLTVAVWAFNAAMAVNPITWIILGIAALIAIIVLLVMHWDEVVAWITDVWQGFVDWIVSVIEGFVGWWNDLWSGFAAWITELWDGFVGWIESVWQGFVDWIIAVMVGYVQFWMGVWNGISDFFTGLWDAIVSFVTDVWQGFVDWIMAVVIGWVSWWRGIWDGVSRFFSDLWDGIVSFVTTAWDNVIGFLEGIPQAILDVFSGAAEWLWGIGEDIMQGLWDGLVSIWDGLIGWISDIGEGIANTFADILGISSPSRVFRGFGVNIGEGLMEGLREVQPEVDAMMEGLAAPPDERGSGSYMNNSNNTSRGDTTILVGSPEEAAEVFELLDGGVK